MYDWANSAFWTTVIVAVFPPFFSDYAAAGLSPAEATARFAWATTLAVTIVALLGPVLGAVADYRAVKKKLLAVFMAVGVVATLLMATIDRGDWTYAALLFIVANIGVAASQVFYDSLLPHIAAPEELDRVSTSGFALGFLGGGVLLLVNLAWILSPATFGLPDTVAAIKLSFASVAFWWLIFSIPLMRQRSRAAAGARIGRDGHRELHPGGAHACLGDVPRASRVSPGVPDARRVPALQRRHPDDHPDGLDLRR